jgi:hypothetical protein
MEEYAETRIGTMEMVNGVKAAFGRLCISFEVRTTRDNHRIPYSNLVRHRHGFRDKKYTCLGE